MVIVKSCLITRLISKIDTYVFLEPKYIYQTLIFINDLRIAGIHIPEQFKFLLEKLAFHQDIQVRSKATNMLEELYDVLDENIFTPSQSTFSI